MSKTLHSKWKNTAVNQPAAFLYFSYLFSFDKCLNMFKRKDIDHDRN